MQIYSKKKIKLLLLPHFLIDFHCLFYLIGLCGGFKTCTQNFENSIIMLIYKCKFIQNHKEKKEKMLLLLHFSTDFDLVCFIWKS